MFSVDGSPIFQSEISILQRVRLQALSTGKDVFKDILETGDDIMVTCPFHKDGRENKPSFGINKNNMTAHCFTCGYSGYLYDVISKIFGYDDKGHYGKQWLKRNFVSVTLDTRERLSLNLDRNVSKKIDRYVSDKELDKYRYIHPYMYERGLNDEIITEFDIGFDIATNCITFPVLDINKNCIFIARRSVVCKWFNYPKRVEKPVYAAYKLMENVYRSAVICESIFNALTCWKYDIPAVALLGTGTKEQYTILNQLPVRKYIIATDGDDAGRFAAKKLRTNLSRKKIVTQWIVPEGKDLNDLDSDILNLQEIF